MNRSCRLSERPHPAFPADDFAATSTRLLNRALAALLAGQLACVSTLAAAQAPARTSLASHEAVVVREVVRGDTLIGIVQEMLDPQRAWQELAAYNALRQPDRIRPGSRLRIPAAWLKPVAVQAKVLNLNGEVRQGERVLKPGDAVLEGQMLETGPDAVVTVELPDGSRLRIAPASAVRLERLRRYHDEQVIDALIRLERGRVEAVAQPGRTRPFLIRSPHATAAVRGTEFRIGALDRIATTEVLTGAVAWSGTGPGAAVSAGFGSTADAQGRVSEPRPLLPAPDLRDMNRTVETVLSEIDFPAVAGAAAYRVEVAADERFERPLLQSVVTEPRVVLDSRQDGVHFVRVRAIDLVQLEGYDARAQVLVHARPIAPQPRQPANGQIYFDTAALLQWDAVAGVQGYRAQLADSADFSRIVLERQLAAPQWQVSAGEGGEGARYWRVASLDAGGREGPFGAVRRIEWRAIPAAPTVAIDGERIVLNWQVPAEHDSLIEVRWRGPAGELTRHHSIARAPQARSVSLPMDALPPGPASAALSLTGPDRVTTPRSRAVGWVVPDPVRSLDGQPWSLGSGGLVGSPAR